MPKIKNMVAYRQGGHCINRMSKISVENVSFPEISCGDSLSPFRH